MLIYKKDCDGIFYIGLERRKVDISKTDGANPMNIDDEIAEKLLKSFNGFVFKYEVKEPIIETIKEDEGNVHKDDDVQENETEEKNEQDNDDINETEYRVIKEDKVKLVDSEEHLPIDTIVTEDMELNKSISVMIKYNWIEEV